MGYTTDFDGRFELDKPLAPKMAKYLQLFNETRRMGRNVDEAFGVEGEFFVFGSGFMGQDNDASVIDGNSPPSTQPSLWCQWTPSEDLTAIVWDGGEKFYYYTEWLVYLIQKILAPNGYVLNGVVTWQGEETGDVGEIFVEDNKVSIQEWKCNKAEVKPQDKIRADIVFILNEEEKLLD